MRSLTFKPIKNQIGLSVNDKNDWPECIKYIYIQFIATARCKQIRKCIGLKVNFHKYFVNISF